MIYKSEIRICGVEGGAKAIANLTAKNPDLPLSYCVAMVLLGNSLQLKIVEVFFASFFFFSKILRNSERRHPPSSLLRLDNHL